jgi:hypothetical protein
MGRVEPHTSYPPASRMERCTRTSPESAASWGHALTARSFGHTDEPAHTAGRQGLLQDINAANGSVSLLRAS